MLYKSKSGESIKTVNAFSNDYYKKFGEYGLSLEALIKNVMDCNNGDPDDSKVTFSGEYPKCYFGLPYANFRDVSPAYGTDLIASMLTLTRA